MFSSKCKLCVFMNTDITYTDCLHTYNHTILACSRYQDTRRARKHTFTYTKKCARKIR